MKHTYKKLLKIFKITSGGFHYKKLDTEEKRTIEFTKWLVREGHFKRIKERRRT